MHLGDTILGIKGRVAFAAPAATLLIDAHRLLEKHTLSQSQRFHKNYLGEWYGMTLHKGLFMEPAMRDVEALMKNSQSKVSGTVKIKLHPYRFELVGVKSPNDIMNREGSDYGEKMGQWSAQDAVGFIKLMSI